MLAQAAALALILFVPARAQARSAHRAAPALGRVATAKPPSALDRARVTLREVKRDPGRRRYRHHWERAIGALEAAARGRDAGPALLEAARARYSLYRFSQVEADREAALRLAERARRAGAKEALVFAAAVRKEMGEEDAPTKKRRVAAVRVQPAGPKAAARSTANPTATATSNTTRDRAPLTPALSPAGGEGGRGDEEPSTDPVLAEALKSVPGASEAVGREGSPARVSEVKTWSNGDYTRIAIYLSRGVAFERQELAAEGALPRRVALDLAPAVLDRELARPVGDALVHQVRAAQRDRDTVRVVLDLTGRDEVSILRLDDPPRLIVDVGAREARREPSAPVVHAPAPPEVEPEAGPRRPVRRIVVDAGHGGHDTGAIGPSGVREKDVTLAIARRLASRLRGRGFEVVLTRDRDAFVPLEERTAIANGRRGDLFVSLHANAHPRRDRHGMETFVLDVAGDRYARRLAARENGALDDDADEGQEVRRILADLDAQASASPSRRLALEVQREVCAGVRGRVGEVRDLGVKSALFHVLLGARMPAVLVETAFISNRVEEQRLRSSRFQDEVADSVARAVERFASREARVASAR
ncbi:MAG TPA: N-acetylmuramoyl-L-alanine amidase [Anaeromyxobacteraceae bacterium]|nr:N-acetylmuramoyl-L-alanine amidase [Anaeromyxobacteraceae bacterium]